MLLDLEILDQKTIDKKIYQIRKIINGKKVIVSYSGGVDSSVIAYFCKEFASETILVMQIGNSVGIGEKEHAAKQASELNLPLKFIEYNETEYSTDYASNPPNRCFYCKNILYKFLNEIKKEKNFDIILSGTNISDLNGHRPGYKSALDNGVINPLVIAEISKQEIRWIAKRAGLQSWNKIATACLASRFPVGITITDEGLQRVAKAEYILRSQFKIDVLRVRDHDKLARIEIGENEYDKILDIGKILKINQLLKDLGYHYVTIDLQGYRPATPTQ